MYFIRFFFKNAEKTLHFYRIFWKIQKHLCGFIVFFKKSWKMYAFLTQFLKNPVKRMNFFRIFQKMKKHYSSLEYF